MIPSMPCRLVRYAEFVSMLPFAACTLEFGLPVNSDIEIPDGFSEPDSYFLKRQRSAYGNDF